MNLTYKDLLKTSIAVKMSTRSYDYILVHNIVHNIMKQFLLQLSFKHKKTYNFFRNHELKVNFYFYNYGGIQFLNDIMKSA